MLTQKLKLQELNSLVVQIHLIIGGKKISFHFFQILKGHTQPQRSSGKKKGI
jgi:hypothetical protein